MKRLITLLLSIACIIPAVQASIAPINDVSINEITHYIDIFSNLRELQYGEGLTDKMKSDIICRTHELYTDIPFLPATLLQNVIFDQTNATQHEKEFFFDFLNPQLQEQSSSNRSSEEFTLIEEPSSYDYSNQYYSGNLSLEKRYENLQFKNLINNQNYIEIFNKQNESQFIPSPLCNDFTNRPFITLTVRRQYGQSCGYWTLANTMALKEQLEYNNNLDINLLYNRSQEIFNEMVQKDVILHTVFSGQEESFELLNTDWAIELAEKINLDTYTILNLQRGSGINIYAEKKSGQNIIAIKEEDLIRENINIETFKATFKILEKMSNNLHKTIINKIKNNKNSYFLFCSGTHWTNFTITKDNNGLAYIIFMNSASPSTTCYDIKTAKSFDGITEFNGQIDVGSHEYNCAKILLKAVEQYNNELFYT